MEVYFKHTPGSVIDYGYLPTSGELLLETKYKYGSLWTRDNQDNLIIVCSGWMGYIKYYYHVNNFDSLNDVTIASIADYDVLRYGNAAWYNSGYSFTSLIQSFFDIFTKKFSINNGIFSSTITPSIGSVLRVNENDDSIYYHSRGPASSSVGSGQWAASTQVGYISFYFSGTDGYGNSAIARLQDIIGPKAVLEINTGVHRYRIFVRSVLDYLVSSGYIFIATQGYNLYDKGYPYFNTLGYTSLTLRKVKNFVPDEPKPLLYLPDGGDFNNVASVQKLNMPDGGTVQTKHGYIYDVNAGGTPTNYGHYGWTGSTFSYFRIYPFSGELEKFNIADYGGINGAIPLPGMRITVYTITGANTYYITSRSGAYWIYRGNNNSGTTPYYEIYVNQNLTTLLSGSIAIEIHRPSGPFYEWVT